MIAYKETEVVKSGSAGGFEFSVVVLFYGENIQPAVHINELVCIYLRQH